MHERRDSAAGKCSCRRRVGRGFARHIVGNRISGYSFKALHEGSSKGLGASRRIGKIEQTHHQRHSTVLRRLRKVARVQTRLRLREKTPGAIELVNARSQPDHNLGTGRERLRMGKRTACRLQVARFDGLEPSFSKRPANGIDSGEGTSMPRRLRKHAAVERECVMAAVANELATRPLRIRRTHQVCEGRCIDAGVRRLGSGQRRL